MNSVHLIGNLTRDVELRAVGSSGSQVGNIGLAVNRRFTVNGERREEVYFCDCEAWGKTAEIAAQYLRKGSKVGIQGRLKNDEWEDKTTGKKVSKTRIVVEQLHFLDAKKEGESAKQSAKPAAAGAGAPDDMDIPFLPDPH